MVTDIEARARAYALAQAALPWSLKNAYLAGAHAEVELERKRIIEALEHKMRTGGTLAFMAAYPEVKKIIEGGV